MPVAPGPTAASLASVVILLEPTATSARSVMPAGGVMLAFAATPTSETSTEPSPATFTDGATTDVELAFAWPLDASIGLVASTPAVTKDQADGGLCGRERPRVARRIRRPDDVPIRRLRELACR